MRRLLCSALLSTALLTTVLAAAPAATGATKTVDRGPTTMLGGAKAGLAGGRDLAYAGGRLYTLDDATVRVFAPGASGNTAPQRTIDLDLPSGQHSWSIAVGDDGTTYVLTSNDALTSSTILVYAAGASGAAGHLSIGNGSLGLMSPIDIAERDGGFALLDNDSNAIFFYAQSGMGAPVAVGGIDAGSSTQTQIFGPSTIDTAPDGRLVVRGADWVSVFAADAQGDVAPTQYLQGDQTMIGVPLGAGLDTRGDLYLATVDAYGADPGNPRVLRFDPGATGNVAPAGVLAGARTGLGLPYLEVLPSGSIAVASFETTTYTFDGAIRFFRPLGPYAAPGRPTKLTASGKKAAPRRTVTWKPAAADSDVPVTAYAVKVTCRGKVKLDRTLPAKTRSVTVRLGTFRRGACVATVRASNEVGSGAVAKARFAVRR
ncbi:hypothetical protein ASC77_12275 [Nocardioides sp. Root1257]|uniref:hypothetical protein n=1 Tax=unclassified Nocardioides TaxID=2615069 RepID=UPI0006FD7E5A|nr:MULTISPECIES: hypothetical protein [unclassified Nocardioides]KQW47256.1 hypothetical protein ASC77_12275 [Nocardioides sp. Root1257]KRC45412.1 hypothetical protein ASE24_12280 [Nocardioides sp. Root224]